MCKYVRRHSKAYNSGRCQRAGGIKLQAPPFHPTICSSVRTSAPLGSPCTSKLIIKSQRSRNNMRWMSPCTIYIGPMIHNGWSKLQYSEFFTLHHASRHLWVCSETRLWAMTIHTRPASAALASQAYQKASLAWSRGYSPRQVRTLLPWTNQDELKMNVIK